LQGNVVVDVPAPEPVPPTEEELEAIKKSEKHEAIVSKYTLTDQLNLIRRKLQIMVSDHDLQEM
jgi:hypothetical protein